MVAIVSGAKDYQLCWHLNDVFGSDFARTEDLEINFKEKKKQIYFSIFEYHDELNNVRYNLISNKFSGEYLIPELKKVDYFMTLKENFEIVEKEPLLEKVRSVKVIQAVFEVNPQELKSKQNLIF